MSDKGKTEVGDEDEGAEIKVEHGRVGEVRSGDCLIY